MHVFATLILGAILFISLGRFPELFPFLAPLQLGKVTALIGLAAVLAINPARLTALLKDTPMGHCLLLLLALSFVSIPFSVLKSGALESFLGLCRMLLMISIMVGLCMGGREQTLRKACAWILLLMAVFTILDRGTGRVQISSTYDPNDLALLFVVYLPVIANEALLGDKWMKLTAAAASFCSIMAIALTGSRGGIIALAAIGLHTVLLVKKRRWILISILVLATLLVGVTANDTLWERFQSLQDSTDYNLEGKTGRLTIWKEGLHLMLTHPLVGVGLGQFPTALGMLGNGAWKAAHNSFIQIGTELGLPGLVAFCAILVSVFRLTVRGANSPSLAPQDRQRFVALRIALTGYCVGGFFLSQAYGFIFFIFLVLAAAMYLQLRETEQTADALRKADSTSPPTDTDRHGQGAELPSTRNNGKRPTASLPAQAAARRKHKEMRLSRGDTFYKHSQGEEGKP
jgi:O-antigen ligase